jgi:MFS family permease
VTTVHAKSNGAVGPGSLVIEAALDAGRTEHGAIRSFLERNRFLRVFAVLSSLMGISVGMAQVATTLYAVDLGSTGTMLGLIAAAQSTGVLFMSLPTGLLVDRLGPAPLFMSATLLARLTYAAIPRVPVPAYLLLCTALISFFMPLRFVSLDTVLLQQLEVLGEAKAGWYLQIANLTRYARIGARVGHGKVSGINGLAGPVGGVLGRFAGGMIGKWIGKQAVFLVLAFGFALSCGACLRRTPAISLTS